MPLDYRSTIILHQELITTVPLDDTDALYILLSFQFIRLSSRFVRPSFLFFQHPGHNTQNRGIQEHHYQTILLICFSFGFLDLVFRHGTRRIRYHSGMTYRSTGANRPLLSFGILLQVPLDDTDALLFGLLF